MSAVLGLAAVLGPGVTHPAQQVHLHTQALGSLAVLQAGGYGLQGLEVIGQRGILLPQHVVLIPCA